MGLPRLLKPFGRPQPENIKNALATWFESELGKQLIQKQSDLLERVLPKFFGYHLIYSGFAHLESVLESSPIKHKVFLNEASKHTQLTSNIHKLPFQTDSTDVMVLQHSFDFEEDPFQVLREATRIILPNGNLIIIGFNPWSLWGVWRAVLFRSASVPWSTRFISPYRLSEWLNILGFDVVGCESGFHMPPIAALGEKESFNWVDRLGSAWLAQRGAFYLLVAKKRVSCITPIRLQSRVRRSKILPISAAGKHSHNRTLPFKDL